MRALLPVKKNTRFSFGNRNLWQNSPEALGESTCRTTGYAELDCVLPGAGWPTGAVTEIHMQRNDIGELQLILPVTANLTQSQRQVYLIAPPYLPNETALSDSGVKMSSLSILNDGNLEKQLDFFKLALLNSQCGAIVWWLDQNNEKLDEKNIQYIHQVAKDRHISILLFRASRAAPCEQSTLRLHITRQEGRTQIRVLKRQGGGFPEPVSLELYKNLLQRKRQRQMPDLLKDFSIDEVSSPTMIRTH
jgi:cell division inhibitor SulA